MRENTSQVKENLTPRQWAACHFGVPTLDVSVDQFLNCFDRSKVTSSFQCSCHFGRAELSSWICTCHILLPSGWGWTGLSCQLVCKQRMVSVPVDWLWAGRRSQTTPCRSQHAGDWNLNTCTSHKTSVWPTVCCCFVAICCWRGQTGRERGGQSWNKAVCDRRTWVWQRWNLFCLRRPLLCSLSSLCIKPFFHIHLRMCVKYQDAKNVFFSSTYSCTIFVRSNQFDWTFFQQMGAADKGQGGFSYLFLTFIKVRLRDPHEKKQTLHWLIFPFQIYLYISFVYKILNQSMILYILYFSLVFSFFLLRLSLSFCPKSLVILPRLSGSCPVLQPVPLCVFATPKWDATVQIYQVGASGSATVVNKVRVSVWDNKQC